jgi:hypothetical protein
MEPGNVSDQEKGRQFAVAFACGVIVVLLLLAAIIGLSRLGRSRVPNEGESLPFGTAEQAYAEHIHFGNLQLSRATNLLNDQFTYVSGIVSNDGASALRGLDVTVEFRDPFNQVVLREFRPLIGPTDGLLGGGERRSFQISFEHVPSEWNQQYPSIRIRGLALE